MDVVWPVLIFVVCFGGGAAACARWLPDLEPGGVGGLAFLCVCGLLAAALALAGLHIYTIVNETTGAGNIGSFDGGIVADGLADILLSSGTLVALALIVYLLALRRSPVPAAAGDPQRSMAALEG